MAATNRITRQHTTELSDTNSRASRRRRSAAGLALGTAALLVSTVAGQSAAFAADAPVGLGTATTYSVLAGTTVTNTGSSVLGADLGVNPGSAITGFPPGQALGATHAGDAVAGQAQVDLTTAYNDAAGRAVTATVSSDLAGQTLIPGVYKSPGALSLSGALTLDGQGDPSAVFIFQAASSLTTASASSIVLTNGAQACNIYWQVGSSAALGTSSTFKGTVMALTSVSVATGATVEGRALARNGAVTLDNNVFTAPNCAAAAPVTTPSPSASAVPPVAAAAPAPSPSASTVPSASPVVGPTKNTDTGAGRGVNLNTAAKATDSGPATMISAAAAVTGLAGVWMLTGGLRRSRKAKAQQVATPGE
ncbi:MAG TPA: ice-binding family protein [Arthrobacter sp.]